ncbi:MAG: hypothetical protein WB710_01335 [Stellaceae bacterium]
MRTLPPHWVFPMLALIVAACEGPPQAGQAYSPLADTTISAEQPGTPATSPANPMSVVIGPNGLHPR